MDSGMYLNKKVYFNQPPPLWACKTYLQKHLHTYIHTYVHTYLPYLLTHSLLGFMVLWTLASLTAGTHYVHHAMAQLIEALHYKPDGQRFYFWRCCWNFSLI